MDLRERAKELDAGMRERARELRASGMACNCDLDNWEPEPCTGHSCVCRIHKKVRVEAKQKRLASIRHPLGE
jgi:hypothetical protein